MNRIEQVILKSTHEAIALVTYAALDRQHEAIEQFLSQFLYLEKTHTLALFSVRCYCIEDYIVQTSNVGLIPLGCATPSLDWERDILTSDWPCMTIRIPMRMAGTEKEMTFR